MLIRKDFGVGMLLNQENSGCKLQILDQILSQRIVKKCRRGAVEGLSSCSLLKGPGPPPQASNAPRILHSSVFLVAIPSEENGGAGGGKEKARNLGPLSISKEDGQMFLRITVPRINHVEFKTMYEVKNLDRDLTYIRF